MQEQEKESNFKTMKYFDELKRSMNYVDSPSTTSAVTYKLQWMETEGTTLYLNRSYQDTDQANFGRAASTITALEVLA